MPTKKERQDLFTEISKLSISVDKYGVVTSKERGKFPPFENICIFLALSIRATSFFYKEKILSFKDYPEIQSYCILKGWI